MNQQNRLSIKEFGISVENLDSFFIWKIDTHSVEIGMIDIIDEDSQIGEEDDAVEEVNALGVLVPLVVDDFSY